MYSTNVVFLLLMLKMTIITFSTYDTIIQFVHFTEDVLDQRPNEAIKGRNQRTKVSLEVYINKQNLFSPSVTSDQPTANQ